MSVLWNVACSLIAGVFALRQYVSARLLDRAERLKKVFEDMNRAEIAETFYRFIEHSARFYDEQKSEFYEGAEQKIDYMLGWFSYICYLRRKGILQGAEFSEFSYQISRALENKDVQNYFYDMYHELDLGVEDERPFGELLRFGCARGNGRMRDLYKEFSSQRGVISKIKRWFAQFWVDKQVVSPSEETVADDTTFRVYLGSRYSKQSADSVFSCANAVKAKFGSWLSPTESKQAMESALHELDAMPSLTRKRISNLKHALKQYWEFRYGQNYE